MMPENLQVVQMRVLWMPSGAGKGRGAHGQSWEAGGEKAKVKCERGEKPREEPTAGCRLPCAQQKRGQCSASPECPSAGRLPHRAHQTGFPRRRRWADQEGNNWPREWICKEARLLSNEEACYRAFHRLLPASFDHLRCFTHSPGITWGQTEASSRVRRLRQAGRHTLMRHS